MLNLNLFSHSHRQHHQGFTLIEVLVAIMIFASLSLAAYQVVNQAQRSNQQSIEKTARIQEIQRALIVMDNDFRQMAPRVFRQGGNEPTQSYFYEGANFLESDSDGIVFIRLGWLNPQSAFPRGEIVKVIYSVEEEQLLRVWWPYPDTPAQAEYLQKPLLSGVEALEFRFYNGEVWSDGWDSSGEFPLAIEVELTLTDYGKISRIYLMPDNAKQQTNNNSTQTQENQE